MSKRIQNQVFIIVSSILAVVFVYILYTKIDKDKTIAAIKGANKIYLIISMVLAIVSYQFRALRWNILYEPMGIKVKNASAFWTISFSYFLNLTIPRSGEIARATSMYSLEKVPVEKSLGTIVLERIVDFLFLLLFFVLTLAFSPKPFEMFLNLGRENGNFSVEGSFTLLYVVIGIFVFLTLLALMFRKSIQRWKGYQKVLEIVRGFKEGLLSIIKVKDKLGFALYTFGIWLCYFLMTFLVIFSFEVTENIPWNYGFFLMIAGSLGMIFPATGGLAYPLVMRYAFGAIFLALGKPLHEGYDAGSYFGISLYLAQIFSVIVFGLMSLYYISRNRITSDSEKNKTLRNSG